MTLYLQDMGVIGALGAGKAEVLRRLLDCDPSGMVPSGPLLTGRSTVVAAARGTLKTLPPAFAEFDCRNNRLLATALDEIAPTVAALRDRLGPRRIAVLIGTSTSGIAAGEDAAETLAATGRMPDEYHYRQQEIGSAAQFAARYLGLAGPRYTVSAACSSSAKAFASAQRLLAAGRCDAAIVGGADSLCRLTLNGFDALELLAREVCNPFSLNRRGITIGEGACVFVLTREPSAIRLCGVGESSDGYHMSAPDPAGKGAELAIRAALTQAGVAPADVGYVNLHGTATPKNDEMEGQVIARVFGCSTPCASTKALTGHTLGGAGALELGLCWLLLSEANVGRRLAPHVWDGVRDPTFDPIDLVGRGVRWERDIFVSNSFAFGGSNATVAIGLGVMDTSAIPVSELVPHGPRITLIDKLESYEANRSIAIATVRTDSLFLEGDGVPAWAGIEYMAQTVAAHAGAEARLRGARPAIGFLIGTRAYRSDVAEFPLGSRLTITVQPLWREGGVAAFDCSIGIGAAALVAAAVINAYLPSEEELARLPAPGLPP